MNIQFINACRIGNLLSEKDFQKLQSVKVACYKKEKQAKRKAKIEQVFEV